jgi:hypothetical protein
MACGAAASVSPEVAGDNGSTAVQPPTECALSIAATTDALRNASQLVTSGVQSSMNADASAVLGSCMPSLYSQHSYAHDELMAPGYSDDEVPWSAD